MMLCIHILYIYIYVYKHEILSDRDEIYKHSIFTIYVETAEKDDQGEQRIKAGKLNLVDLAGSER